MDIVKAIKGLNKDKSDGNVGFTSNHLLHGGNKLYVLLSLLFNAMIVHSHTPDIMLKSTIISIPKNASGDLSNSENYRGITLCNSLCKVFDLLFINFNPDVQLSSNCQFAFKKNHSTNLCTLMLKETIAHYISRGSNVYACFIDASKAFDKINIVKLFNILLKRNILPDFVSLLLDSYERQQVCFKWQDTISEHFNVSNGVRQGGILSPLLFNIYMDELLFTLERNGVGCYMGHHYFGAIGYADDLTLICPNRNGLQKMLNNCEEFGVNFNVTFNPNKTVSCIFSKKLCNAKQVKLCDVELEWRQSVNCLGNLLSYNLKDESDVNNKRGDFIGSVNSLLANFKIVSSNVLNCLFKSYCCAFYGSPTWVLGSKCLNTLYTSFNKGLRHVWRLPYNSHRNILYSISGLSSLNDILISRFISCFNSMVTIDNHIVNYVAANSITDASGPIGQNLRYIESCNKLLWFRNSSNVNLLNNDRNNHDEDYKLISDCIKELCNCRDDILSIEGLDKNDVLFMIDHLSSAVRDD